MPHMWITRCLNSCCEVKRWKDANKLASHLSRARASETDRWKEAPNWCTESDLGMLLPKIKTFIEGAEPEFPLTREQLMLGG